MSTKTRTRTGPIFFAGRHEGKGGDFTADDLKSMAANFTAPLKVRCEHQKTLLDGLLGQVTRVWHQVDEKGRDALFGSWEQPEWLADLLGDTPVPVSAEIALTPKKRLDGLAMVCEPYFPEAAIFSAYACFSQGKPVVPLVETTAQMSTRIANEIISRSNHE
jgi:hypothetical protein